MRLAQDDIMIGEINFYLNINIQAKIKKKNDIKDCLQKND